jgi:hypothetical protein
MSEFLHFLKRVLLLACAAAWFQTVAHTVVCHSDNALFGHDGCSESTVCSCVCHAAFEPADDAPLFVRQPCAVLLPTENEPLRGLLLPSDIFRPPLARS